MVQLKVSFCYLPDTCAPKPTATPFFELFCHVLKIIELPLAFLISLCFSPELNKNREESSLNRRIHAPLSWKAEQVGGYPVSITRTLLASVAAGKRYPPGICPPAVKLDAEDLWTAFTAHRPQHSGCLVSGPKHLIYWTLCQRRKKKRRCSYVIVPKMPHTDYFFFLMATGQNLQYGVGLYILFFIYLYNICTDFLLNMKDELTSGMPENTEVILFACFSIWGFFF